MESINLLFISLAAFVAVFVLLTVLALLMRLILLIFPEQAESEVTPSESDAAVIAAVTTVVSATYPGTQVTNVEEVL